MAKLKAGCNKTGLITTKNGQIYLFRADVPFEYIFAWNIHDDIINDRQICHKWKNIVIEKGMFFEFFSIDYPPQTVRYIPF
jgi:hypothetical protein